MANTPWQKSLKLMRPCASGSRYLASFFTWRTGPAWEWLTHPQPRPAKDITMVMVHGSCSERPTHSGKLRDAPLSCGWVLQTARASYRRAVSMDVFLTWIYLGHHPDKHWIWHPVIGCELCSLCLNASEMFLSLASLKNSLQSIDQTLFIKHVSYWGCNSMCCK